MYCLYSIRQVDILDDIHSGYEVAIDKLTHYYDNISPMVGVALILSRTMKKDFLSDALD